MITRTITVSVSPLTLTISLDYPSTLYDLATKHEIMVFPFLGYTDVVKVKDNTLIKDVINCIVIGEVEIHNDSLEILSSSLRILCKEVIYKIGDPSDPDVKVWIGPNKRNNWISNIILPSEYEMKKLNIKTIYNLKCDIVSYTPDFTEKATELVKPILSNFNGFDQVVAYYRLSASTSIPFYEKYPGYLVIHPDIKMTPKIIKPKLNKGVTVELHDKVIRKL